ncbi:MAG: pilus assembly PilX N-terminal domain-containing protein [Candidatus Acidiferrales bacterium]
MRIEREKGIALITAMLVLFLISALVVGMSWMVMSDARLSGNNENREIAFYGAEAGMERMTAEMGNEFAIQGALTPANITTIEADAPVIPGITYVNALGASTYQITPEGETTATILPPSPYAGMNGLITPYTLTVAAQADNGSEVKLQRTVQLVAIPVFQFGIFSQTDLAFFAGPPFDFGGRVHTNGNLWLAANDGPLYMRDRVTISGQVIRTNLENGVAVNASSYPGTVTIADPAELPTTTAYPPSPSYTNSQWRALALTEGSVSGNSVYGAISTTPNNPTWSKTVVPAYQGMLTNGVTPLNLQSTALGGLSSPVNLVRRPLVGELAANPAQFAQRQFSQASVRILIDDYPTGSTGPNGLNACVGSEMLLLDTVSPTVPIDLATLTAKPAWWPATTTFYPMPTSDAAAANYTTYTSAGAKDGYWQTKTKPIITGCIKIEYQPSAGPPFVDVTQEVLGLGFTARNINPTTTGALNELLFLPATGTVVPAETSECGTTSDTTEPSPNAILRITRLRDNPSTAYSGAKNACTFAGTVSTDYWPLVLYDAREAQPRDNALPNNANDAASNHPEITAEGVMDYIELDVNNLSRWFTGAIGANGTKADNVGGFSVYFSDRRGNQTDPTAGFGVKTGAFGFNDIVNGTSDPANGCPNGALDAGEDLEGDGKLRTYGGLPLTAVEQTALGTPTLGIYNLEANLSATNLVTPVAIFVKNPNCATLPAVQPSPIYVYEHNQEARENPPVFFRRALKLEYGSTLNLGTSCYGAAPNPPCGLTIAAENPVYIQGEYNDGGVNTGAWTGTNVAAGVMADTVTFLSDSWNDVNSFISPYDPNSRPGNTTSYRVAIISGKGIPFSQPAGTAADYGTDGGLHNFLRYVETWGGTLYYKGSLVSFYFNRAGTGLYKCCTTVYNPPTRGYTFDADFSQGPQWLPPRTPKLTSINTIGFSQELLPTQ